MRVLNMINKCIDVGFLSNSIRFMNIEFTFICDLNNILVISVIFEYSMRIPCGNTDPQLTELLSVNWCHFLRYVLLVETAYVRSQPYNPIPQEREKKKSTGLRICWLYPLKWDKTYPTKKKKKWVFSGYETPSDCETAAVIARGRGREDKGFILFPKVLVRKWRYCTTRVWTRLLRCRSLARLPQHHIDSSCLSNLGSKDGDHLSRCGCHHHLSRYGRHYMCVLSIDVYVLVCVFMLYI